MINTFFNRLTRRAERPPLKPVGEARVTAPAPAQSLAAVAARVDDSPGWGGLTGRPHDYDAGTLQELYQDALSTWRKNPIAWRIIAITADYVVGDAISISSPVVALAQFISEFWHHPQNHMDLRLETMCDELARSGDLFVLLFRNAVDGMSYLRFITKDAIRQVETAENDWENEIAYHELGVDGKEQVWLSPTHPQAAQAPAIMLHYSINRPLGALLGEGDLTTLIPWLQRYSRMLEDRVRLHWAIRAFLWIVTVPSNLVREKQEQYRRPPEAGSIIIKDESETWGAVAPELHGADARHDLTAVRGMIDAGSGYPPHWRGEAADANLATATAMQAPTERHLLRRQRYFTYLLEDILFQAYQRGVQAGRLEALPTNDYTRLFTVSLPEISRSDNEALARSARDFSNAIAALSSSLTNPVGVPQVAPTTWSPGGRSFRKLALKLLFRFAGEPLDDGMLEKLVDGE